MLDIIKIYHWYIIRREATLVIWLERNWICFPYLEIYYNILQTKLKMRALKKGEIEVWWLEYDFILHLKRELYKINNILSNSKSESIVNMWSFQDLVLNSTRVWIKRNK